MIRKFLNFKTMLPNEVSNHRKLQRLKLLTSLRLGLSSFCEYKVKHNFLEIINRLFSFESDD